MFSKNTYIERRSRLKQKVEKGILLFLGNEESGMNYEENTYHFRQDSTFLYFFGLPYAGLNAIIDLDENKEIIFGDELSIDHIVWMGNQPTLKEKSEKIGIEHTEPSHSLAVYLQKAILQGRKVHFLPPYRAEHKLKLAGWLEVSPKEQANAASVEFIKAVVGLRSYKSAEEIEEIEKACDITADMHIAAISVARPGMKEYEVVAALEAVAYSRGGSLSFPTIATVNGQTLHNHYHGNTLREGDLMLIDAGAETAMGYAGDMSSTLPVSKKFSVQQKDIYDIQVASHLAAVEALRPGVLFSDVYDISASVVFDGLKSLGITKGNTRDAVAAGVHAMFFPCGLGHMMGLDVHDMENLGEVWVGYDGQPKSTQFGRKSLRLGRKLEAGFVLTIEPGIYFIPELIDLWKNQNKFADFICYEKLELFRRFGGIRNEEDFLITDFGARRLGKKIPLTTDEVEALR
ncbi:MAG: Xaa-Pro aminopeptidase [Bacteroidetes bacterium]|nr:Xaa-Pro aminopeptidase [Bacteroidota bacterium]